MFVNAQNAGLIVRKDTNSIIFEAFELSPPNSTVMTTKGRLRRYFPGPAMAVDLDTFNESGFQSALAHTIAKMSHQVAAEMKPKADKAGQVHFEDRDTTNPKLVTEFLMSFLEAVGHPVSVPRIWKNTREEVLWSSGLVPWRRSSVWLLTRVAIQVAFSRSARASDYYKEFMIFFMVRILDLAREHKTSSELLHCLTCKISRRLRKLEPRLERYWLPTVEDILSKTVHFIEVRWNRIIETFDPDIQTSTLATLNFTEDAVAQLPELEEQINLINYPPKGESHTGFSRPPLLARLPPDVLPTVQPSTESNVIYLLAAFETWIASELDNWLCARLLDDDTCARLSQLIQEYHDTASQHYSGNPENISLMLLTCLELWIACDKSATLQHPLLLDYDPAIPSELLQSLILPLKYQMERLLRVETYLKERRRKAKPHFPSVFSGFGLHNSFSVRFYASSEIHKDLRAQIEKFARDEREQKKSELVQKQREYARLMQLHRSLSACEFKSVFDYGYRFTKQVHSSSCMKCYYHDQAQSMSIEMHEWPLPRSELHAQSTVFELDCPPTINNWRDATIFIILDVLKSEYHQVQRPQFHYTPEHCLSRFTKRHPQRLSLLSETRPHAVTHRWEMSVSTATESAVCVHNGLTYHYYDNRSGCFVKGIRVSEKIPIVCTYQLQCSASLQDFLYRPHSRPNGPEPNVVISSQSSCPDHMSLEEFKSLAALPLGTRTQWSNILVQLSIPSVDFKKVDTILTLLQTVRQAGPPSENGVARDGHQDLCDEFFGSQLIGSLLDGLGRIKKNWESCQALGGFIIVSTRLLSLTTWERISSDCLKYLQTCRRTALRWARLVRDMARETTDQNQRAEFLLRAFEISQICASTFDVDHHHLQSILSEPSEGAIFIECSIMIQETTYGALRADSPVQQLCTQRWRRLSSRAFPELLDEVTGRGNTCLDIAIEKSWPEYRPAGGWRSHSAKLEHWLTTETAADSNSRSQRVHYNLLTGELLVDGLPLSRLPVTFEQHPTYEKFFGRATVEVMSTRMSGMQFSAMKPFQGYTVFFGLHPHSGSNSSSFDFMLTCIKDQERYDLLPSRIFRGRMPDHFVRDYAHWYHRSSGVIEFRPITSPWRPSPNHWILSKEGRGWIMRKGDSISLISMTSRTCKVLSQIFSSVESAPHVHVLLHSTEGLLDLELPRLKLGFFLHQQSPRIHSRQFRGMFLDTSPRIGTLVGLKSKIVLRNDQDHRVILVPDGIARWESKKSHINVWIEDGTSTKVHPFHIDKRLGRVLDNGTLQSKLALCYLHALTAYCLPDELTQKTGTEQALEMLSSAAVRSFDCLTPENFNTLHMIANLTPRREYYPSHERLMQNVKWVGNLSPLSQHGRLYADIKSILSQATSLEFFYQSKLDDLQSLDHMDEDLLQRDLGRSSTFRRSGFGAEHHTATYDRIYQSRDSNPTEDSRRAKSVLTTASRIFRELHTSQTEIPSGLADRMWDLLDYGKRVVNGPRAISEDWVIGYDAERLEDWRKFLGTHWCQIHRALGQNRTRFDKFRIMMFLATLAFSQDVDAQAVQVLVALCTIPEIARLDIPEAQSFDLGRGRNVDVGELKEAVEPHLKKFWDSPEYELIQLPCEDEQEMWDRRQRCFSFKQSRIRLDFVNALERQWPCEAPQKPTGNGFDIYIDTSSAMQVIRQSFKTWWENRRFYLYLDQIGRALRLQPVSPLSGSMSRILPPSPNAPRRRAYITMADLFSRPAPLVLPMTSELPQVLMRSNFDEATNNQCLSEMVSCLEKKAKLRHEHAYVEDLRKSLACLQARTMKTCLAHNGESVRTLLEQNVDWCIDHVCRVYNSLVDAVGFNVGNINAGQSTPNLSESSNSATYNSPRVSAKFFLGQLARKRWVHLSPAWQQAVVTYGLAIATLQRAERLLSLCGNAADLIKELLNSGHTNWYPLDYPESLLIEVESGILIREVQEEIAAQMRDPPGKDNAVMQLNMGEGKSSVIVPVVAAALADGSKLVRVVVAKPQSRQMLQMLVSKLGGLCDHQIYHMPFSRSLRLGEAEVRTISQTYRTCMETCGILLIQPEHILSFKLMGIESLLSCQHRISRSLLDTQHFFDSYSRDVVDESDENFSVKFELIYTIGTQRPIELSPERWSLIQSVLRIIAKVAPEVKKELPLSIEVDKGPRGSFSRTRFLRQDSHERLCGRLAEEICSSGLPGFPVARQSEAVRKAVFKYITEPELSSAESSAVESCATFWTESVKKPLLLLRGLIAGGVLGFVFGHKRWRVNYGLDLSRQPKTKLAVPFRAKDSPTLRSEFSHPDVVIVLTCLSYYYGGLGDDDLFLAFEHLVKSDQADIEYGDWVRDAADLPGDSEA